MIHVMSIDKLNKQKELLKKAKSIFCSKRFLKFLPDEYKSKVKMLIPIDKSINYLKKNLNEEIIIITSGDPLFWGIGRNLLKEIPKSNLIFYPGLTTVQKVCAQFKLPWDDMDIISLHGRTKDIKKEIIGKILSKIGNFKIGIYTDNKNTPTTICNVLINAGIDNLVDDLKVLVAQDVDGSDENFFELDIHEAAQKTFHPLNFMILLGSNNNRISLLGIKDESFSHQKGLITKKEIRINILSELRLLGERGVFWDIGAGSGSISIEAALLNPHLNIFAVEKDQNRCLDIKKNINKFLTPNITVINKEAPQALSELPRPNRIFIGGGIGTPNLLDVAFNLLKKDGILVISTILIESLNRVLAFSQKYKIRFKAVQISISNLKELGKSFIVSPNPPITIFTLWKD